MTRGVAWAVAVVLSIGSTAASWASGYFLLFDPIAALGGLLVLYVLLAIIAMRTAMVAGGGTRPTHRRMAVVAGVLALAALPLAAPWQAIGFEHRVLRTSDADWHRLAHDARARVQASSRDGRLPMDPSTHGNRRHVAELATRYPVLRAGRALPKLFVGEEAVLIDWGSGLLGAHAVEICTDETCLARAPDGLHRRKQLSDRLWLVLE